MRVLVVLLCLLSDIAVLSAALTTNHIQILDPKILERVYRHRSCTLNKITVNKVLWILAVGCFFLFRQRTFSCQNVAPSAPVSSPVVRRSTVYKRKCMPWQKACPIYGSNSQGSTKVIAGYECINVLSDLEYVTLSSTALLRVNNFTCSDHVEVVYSSP